MYVDVYVNREALALVGSLVPYFWFLLLLFTISSGGNVIAILDSVNLHSIEFVLNM